MSDIKQVVSQLRSLAAEPDNRAYIVQDKTCFEGIVKFLENPEPEVVFIALECLQYLTLRIENRPQMVANAPLLGNTLKRLMMDFALPGTTKQIAGNVYANLQKAFESQNSQPANKENNVPTSAASPGFHTPLKDTTNKPMMFSRTSTPCTQRENLGLSFFSEKVNTSANAPKTFTVYIKTLSNDNKPQLERTLLQIGGVVSFLLDIQRHRAVIRYQRTAPELITAIKQNGMPAMIIPDDLEGSPTKGMDKENDYPDYLPEPSANGGSTSSWFSSIVSWGTTTVDERKESQKRNEKKRSFVSNRFITRIFSVGDTLWQ